MPGGCGSSPRDIHLGGGIAVNLREALYVIWRRRALILVVALLGPLAVWLVGRPAGMSDETYSASVNIEATPVGEFSPIPQYAFVATDTIDIAARVADDVNQAYPGTDFGPADIQQLVAVTPLPDINLMTIAVRGEASEDSARLIVERFGFHLIEHITEQREAEINQRDVALAEREKSLRDEVEELDKTVKEAQGKRTAAEVENDVMAIPVAADQLEVARASLRQVLTERDALRQEQAAGAGGLIRATGTNVSTDPVATDPLGLNSRLLLATVLAGALGVGLAFALHRFDTRLYTRKDAEVAFGLPVLAEIPRVGWLHRRNSQLIARSHPEAPASEAYRLLRSSLAQAARLFQMRAGGNAGGNGDASTVVLVTSVSDQVGKTTTVANLAVAAVDARKRVLVVSADLRRPSVHTFFGVVPGPGLTDAVDAIEEEGVDAVELDGYLAKTSVLGTTLIRSGHPVPHPGERLALALPLIQQARHQFDLIIIDTPAMLLGNDVNELISAVDLVLLVAKAGATTLEEAEWSRETAERLQAPVCGVALVGASSDLHRRGKLGNFLSRLTRRIVRRPKLAGDSASGLQAALDGDAASSTPKAPVKPASSRPSGPSATKEPTATELAAATTITLWPNTGGNGSGGGVTAPHPAAPQGKAPHAAGQASPRAGSPLDNTGTIPASELLASLGAEQAAQAAPAAPPTEVPAADGTGAGADGEWLKIVDNPLDGALVDEDEVGGNGSGRGNRPLSNPTGQ
jgi:Mrp family chromosome partitioning ATPase/capsular polysaccharide biosynthesis protein